MIEQMRLAAEQVRDAGDVDPQTIRLETGWLQTVLACGVAMTVPAPTIAAAPQRERMQRLPVRLTLGRTGRQAGHGGAGIGQRLPRPKPLASRRLVDGGQSEAVHAALDQGKGLDLLGPPLLSPPLLNAVRRPAIGAPVGALHPFDRPQRQPH